MSADAITEEQYRAAKLNILAGIETQLTLIAQNTAHADVHLSEEQVREAWPLRMYEDDFVEAVKNLGITID